MQHQTNSHLSNYRNHHTFKSTKLHCFVIKGMCVNNKDMGSSLSESFCYAVTHLLTINQCGQKTDCGLMWSTPIL